MRIVLSGMVAGDPHQGGATWAVLQWALGLERLGHDVLLVEPVEDPITDEVATYFESVIDRFALRDRAALVARASQDTVGLSYDHAVRLSRDADLLLNLSGMLDDEQLIGRTPKRGYVDLDPAFTQLWHADGIDMGFDRHDAFVTVGLDIGAASAIPTCEREWITTLPPVVLEHWPVASELTHDALTTVGSWRGYGSIHRGGVRYGQKAHSLRSFMDLPTLTDAQFEIAMGIHSDERDDLARLDAGGWTVIDPRRVAGTPDAYREFVAGSRAEIGIAKEGYVVSQSGWFSDRSACYLASGRPVIAQDTGFSRHLSTGKGLFAFSTADDVIAALEDLDADYPSHTRAARALAEEHLDSDDVLTALLEKLDAC